MNNVNLERVALVPLGMNGKQMESLFTYLQLFFKKSKQTQLLKPKEQLTKVELRLQSLPGIDAVIPAGEQCEWMEKIDLSKSGLVVACPASWINYFANELFMGAQPLMEVTPGMAMEGNYGISDRVSIVPFRRI